MHETNDRQSNQVPEGRGGPSPALIGAIVVAAIAVIFVLQNSDRVTTEFLFLSFDTRVWTAIVVAIIIGVALDRLVQVWWRRRRSE